MISSGVYFSKLYLGIYFSNYSYLFNFGLASSLALIRRSYKRCNALVRWVSFLDFVLWVYSFLFSNGLSGAIVDEDYYETVLMFAYWFSLRYYTCFIDLRTRVFNLGCTLGALTFWWSKGLKGNAAIYTSRVSIWSNNERISFLSFLSALSYYSFN